MAISFVCAVYDVKSESFGQPAFVPAKGLAIRGFIDEVNREEPNNMLNKYPEDFALFFLGTFDHSSGEFEPSDIGKDLLMEALTAKQVK